MRIPGALVALACVGALAAAPTPAHAQTRSITCESRDDDRNDCFVANLDQGSVSVSRKLSQSGCVKGSSWGTSRDNIWVSRGCRAIFAYRERGGYSSGGGRAGTITCESRNDQRKECYVADLDPSSVTMDELLSETTCVRGRNWDARGSNIWVSGGCRARFGYVTQSGGSGGNTGGYGGGGRAGTITCESRNDQRKECYVANLDPSSVTMDERLSETTCIRGRNWDAQGSNIWVSGGCRARFGYVTRSGGSGGYNSGGSASSSRQACIERASREWSVTESNLEITGTNRLDGGRVEYLVSSKRTKGSCTVDSNGRVRSFSTW